MNHERAEEKSRGLIRWLRPEFQNPNGTTQTSFAGDDKQTKSTKTATTKVEKQPWPKTLPERMVAIQSALTRHDGPAAGKEVAAFYTRVKATDIEVLLQTLVAVGLVRQLDDGRCAVYK